MKSIDTPFNDFAWRCEPPLASNPQALLHIVAAREGARALAASDHQMFDAERLSSSSPWEVMAIRFPDELSLFARANINLPHILLIDKRGANAPLTWLEILWHVHVAVAMSRNTFLDHAYFEGLAEGAEVKGFSTLAGVPVFDAFMGSQR